MCRVKNDNNGNQTTKNDSTRDAIMGGPKTGYAATLLRNGIQNEWGAQNGIQNGTENGFQNGVQNETQNIEAKGVEVHVGESPNVKKIRKLRPRNMNMLVFFLFTMKI